MPEGFEVRPEDLRRGAAALRDDAGRLGVAGSPAADGADAAASAAGDGPLAEAASALAARLETLFETVTGSVHDCADALEAASTQYLAADQDAASTLGGPGSGPPDGSPPIVVPGAEPPR